jgi:hypothetical protein
MGVGILKADALGIAAKFSVTFLVNGPSISVNVLIENQQMHQNGRFVVMSSQTLLHVSAY